MKLGGLVSSLTSALTGIDRPGKVRTWRAPIVAPVSINTGGNVTLTIEQLLSGIIVRDPNGGARADVLPTAALVVAGIPGVRVGDIVRCLIVNGADAAEAITFTAGSGGALDTNQTAASASIGQNASKTIAIRITGVSTPAYVAYV